MAPRALALPLLKLLLLAGESEPSPATEGEREALLGERARASSG